MNIKKIIELSLIIFTILIVGGCSEPISFELNKGEQRESEQPYYLTDTQSLNAEDLYIAIRDMDNEKIKKLVDRNLITEFKKNPTLLIELSSYIPYYEKLKSKKMMGYKNINSTEYGKLLQADFRYEYETRVIFYNVIFAQDDPKATILGAHLKLDMLD